MRPTSQYPFPVGVEAIPTIGASGLPFRPPWCAAPNENAAPFSALNTRADGWPANAVGTPLAGTPPTATTCPVLGDQ
jgi:hypothetical protein